MRKKKHTPTPWTLRLYHPGIKNKFFDIYKEGRPDTLATTAFHGWTDNERAANAEFIIRAVNSHEALVKALRAVLRPTQDLKTYWALRRKAQEALKLAKKQGA